MKDYLSNDPIPAEEKDYYEKCKTFFQLTRQPLVSISENIRNNDEETKSAVFKFAIDKQHDAFDLGDFISSVCMLLKLDPADISIKKIQKGSIIMETELSNKLRPEEKKLKIRMIYTLLTERLPAELGKLKIFFMYMGPVRTFFRRQNFREVIRLNPNFDKIYCKGQTYWEGALEDGKYRGMPYFCPVGWRRHSFYVTDNFNEKFDGYAICYHATKFIHGLSILLSGLKPAERNEHGDGIYTTPSINYAAHPRYSEVKLIDTVHQREFFRNGQYVQFVLECRVPRETISREAKETLCTGDTVIDPNISNDKIEWIIDNKNKTLVDFNDPDSPIVCTGLMMRVTDNHPGLLPESQWWEKAHLCNDKNCCYLGIQLIDLNRQKHKGEGCNIIYD